MKTRVLLAVTVLAGFAASAQAASIVGSKHDLSSAIVSGNSLHSLTQDQTCVFCHAPHNATVNKLLWNRTGTPVASLMYIYTSYNTGTMRTALPQSTLAGDSSSLLCLSCHALGSADAVISNVQNGQGGTAPGGAYTATNFPGRTGNMNNLTNDHPVGIDYEAAHTVDSTGLKPTTVGTTKVGSLRLFKSSVSGTSTMECGTCHSVHDPANGKFLAKPNTQSALCTTCHIK